MSCSDCTAARHNRAHNVFDPRCPYCGARYAMAVRTTASLILPASVAGQEMSRRQWYEHVLATWAGFGHDAKLLRELADADAIPYEPVRRAGKGKSDG